MEGSRGVLAVEITPLYTGHYPDKGGPSVARMDREPSHLCQPPKSLTELIDASSERVIRDARIGVESRPIYRSESEEVLSDVRKFVHKRLTIEQFA